MCFSSLFLDLLHDLGHTVLNVNEENLRQLLRQLKATKSLWWHGRIDRVGSEVSLLLCKSLIDRDLVNNILLRSIFDTDIAETELHFLIHDHLLGVSTTVHDIDLCDNTYGTDTLFIELLRHLQTI